MSDMRVEYCGEHYEVAPGRPFVIGRGGDLYIDDNPYLHRRFLQIEQSSGLWWLANTSAQISATVTEPSGRLHAWLSPGARLPLVFPTTAVLFTAGPTTYEVTLIATTTPYALRPNPGDGDVPGNATVRPVALTDSQRLLLVALAEPMLRDPSRGVGAVPASSVAAARLGWAQTRFNRKLDNVCEKLDRWGVRGLRSRGGVAATNRRARLVEFAIGSRLVTADDLPLLDSASAHTYRKDDSE